MDIEINMEGYWPQMWLGYESMRGVFKEIVENALTNTKSGRQTCIDAHCLIEGERVTINLTDHGMGFDPNKKVRIFRPMTRLPGSTGAGMGLAIVARVMELHDGSASAESTINQGATITLRFPESRIVGAEHESGTEIDFVAEAV